MIRNASNDDLDRIAEIEVFNYRLKFYPIFLDDGFYFGELQVPNVAKRYADSLAELRVWDDGVVKGFILVRDGEVKKLFVEPVLQGRGIGARLLQYAVEHMGARTLWALEKNEGAIRFYQRHGFRLTGERKPEDGTSEYLVRMQKYEKEHC